MTFSIVARCERTGQFGMAVSSSSPAVAARCAHAAAGIGAVASQNVTDPRLGHEALRRMAAGATAAEAVAALAGGRFAEYRQILAVDRAGGVAIHSGTKALGVAAEALGAGCVAAGNLLGDAGVPAAMLARFAGASGPLAARLVAALRAGLDAGGEAGPVHSAGLLVVREEAWPYVDLRCDWTEGCPVAALEAAWAVYAPQADAYVTRALDPGAAPSYGVPGDE